MTLYEYCIHRMNGRQKPNSRQAVLERMVTACQPMATMTGAQIVEHLLLRFGKKGWEYQALKRMLAAYAVHCRRNGMQPEEISLCRREDDGRRTRWAKRRKAAQLVWMVAVAMLLSGCRTTRVVTVTENHTDTLRINQQQRDSIWLHDSIYLHEYQRGETLYVERTQWRVKYVERVRVDTVYHARVDSVPVVQIVEVEKRQTWWQRTKQRLTTLALIACAAAAAAMWIRLRRGRFS